MERVLAVCLVTQHLSFAWKAPGIVFAHKLAVVALERDFDFAIYQSTIHEQWSRRHGSTLGKALNYSPSDCLEKFPNPPSVLGLDSIGRRYEQHRAKVLSDAGMGLTKTYNRFHDRGETSQDIAKLRELHVEMDQAVAAAYDWDFDLGHDFHETDQGTRYTLSPSARRNVLDRLLELNHKRYAEEVAQGLHEKKKPKTKRKRNSEESPQTTMFDAPNSTTPPAAKSAKKRNS
jgi:hypothetical protein